MTAEAVCVGWDIGGVNLKVALVRGPHILAVRSLPFSIQYDFDALPAALAELMADIGAPPDAPQAVTMTAELSQRFRTKAEGVSAVLHALERTVGALPLHVLDVRGAFRDAEAARASPLDVAASNWTATALLVAETESDCLLADTGSTTTDLIPIAGGRIVALGCSDPDRLASGELVYSGAVRTPVEAIVREVPWRGRSAAVAAEGFALTGDVHLWRRALSPSEYTAPTPDGRAPTREFAGERLARVICADRTLVDDAGIDAIAAAAAEAQIAGIAAAMRRVAARHPSTRHAVTAGIGGFIAAAAAERAGLAVIPLARRLGSAARLAPAAAVALLLAARLSRPAAPPTA
jgi:probable H4MPT-linked C1 transfer pathway protein